MLYLIKLKGGANEGCGESDYIFLLTSCIVRHNTYKDGWQST